MTGAVKKTDEAAGGAPMAPPGLASVQRPLVSVVTPAYNHERFIARSIESLLRQTYSRWEQVIVDDGSTDGTADVVKQFKDSRIIYRRQDNLGVGRLAATINNGLAHTRGTLVSVLPSDDTWPEYRLERQVPLFADQRVILVHGNGSVIDESDCVIGRIRPSRAQACSENRPVGSILHDLLLQNSILHTTVMTRRSALDRIGGYQQPRGLLAEDYPTFLALSLQGEFRYQDLSLGNYRMHQAQMTRNHHAAMMETDVAYALEFFRGLSPAVQALTGWSEDELRDASARSLVAGAFAVGRRDLLVRSWSDARRHFVRALVHGDPLTKLKSLVGIAFSLAHRDVEGLARVLGRPPLK